MKHQGDQPTGASLAVLERIAAALERLAGAAPAPVDWAADAFVWSPDGSLLSLEETHAVPLALLKGIDLVKGELLGNTERFAAGYPANNALLWGARGMGKSSLVKAVHAAVNAPLPAADRLALVEIHREDIAGLPALLRLVRAAPRRVILFCDDLSFEKTDTSYKALKAALEGGLEGRPANALFYATSNRRHLMPREIADNEQGGAVNPGEAVDETISLSDRFGLWLGFHGCSQGKFLAMIEGYVAHFGLAVSRKDWEPAAIAWMRTRGSRSGRVASQFVTDLAGRLGQRLG